MHCVDLYSRVWRACHVEETSQSAAERQFGIDRKTVANMLGGSTRGSSRSCSRIPCSRTGLVGPGKGNDKGSVEGVIGFARRDFARRSADACCMT